MAFSNAKGPGTLLELCSSGKIRLMLKNGEFFITGYVPDGPTTIYI